jgi:asparagine synthase (glutamine-hydrolysing)
MKLSISMHFKDDIESVCALCFKKGIWRESSNPSMIVGYVGSAYTSDNDYLFNDVDEKISDFFNVDNLNDQLKEKIQNIKGHYSFVLETQDYVLAVVDRIRSYPIYYTDTDNILISNSVSDVQGSLNLNDIDNTSLLEFKMSGYIIGRETLYKGVYQLLPGEYLLYDKKNKKLHRERYYQYGLGGYKSTQKTEAEILEELHQLHLKIFSEMIESLDGRPVWIPLSGGLDSRFILGMLLELKYDNITTFSYGPDKFWEIKRAKEIANFLNIKWHHISYDPKQTRKLFDTKDREAYYKYAWGVNAVPVLNDYYAILMMRKSNFIPDNAVFINGQSGDFLTGGHIPDTNEADNYLAALLENIINKNHSLWEDLKTEDNLNYITEKILSIINISSKDKISRTDLAKYYEFYEWQERQCKFVVNGQRVYEWFGYDWRLPLWHDELMFFWERVPWEVKTQQKLFKRYLDIYNPASLFNKKWHVPDYQHTPLVLRVATSFARKIAPSYNFQQNFTEYYSTYSAFYPQSSYWKYLKESKGHRNAVSFHAKLIADKLKNR